MVLNAIQCSGENVGCDDCDKGLFVYYVIAEGGEAYRLRSEICGFIVLYLWIYCLYLNIYC